MSKFKIEHGASRINLVLLKTNIEESISRDLDLMAAWSDNDPKYLVNELLRFALAQEEDFQEHKAAFATNAAQPAGNTTAAPAPIKSVTNAVSKYDPPTTPVTARG